MKRGELAHRARGCVMQAKRHGPKVTGCARASAARAGRVSPNNSAADYNMRWADTDDHPLVARRILERFARVLQRQFLDQRLSRLPFNLLVRATALIW